MTLFNATRAELHEIHAGLTAGLENGTLTPVVAKELPLADAVKSHVAVMEPGALGKIVLGAVVDSEFRIQQSSQTAGLEPEP